MGVLVSLQVQSLQLSKLDLLDLGVVARDSVKCQSKSFVEILT
jgi:hypothetical protein